MAFEKSDYPDENITVRDFYRALSESLKRTTKDPLSAFEQLLDAGLKVSTGHFGYVGSTPIPPGNIKVAIRKAARAGKQGAERLDAPITIQTTTPGEHLTNQELGDFQKRQKILRKKIQSEIDEGRTNDFTLNEGNLNSLSLEENQNAVRLLDPAKKKLADLFINHANADKTAKILGEESCPWPGQHIEPKTHQEPLSKQDKTHIFKKNGAVWLIGPIDNPKSFPHKKGFVYIRYLLGEKERIEELKSEKELILREIKPGAVRSRYRSLDERLRKRIQKNIKNAQDSLFKETPELGSVLSITTGNDCRYNLAKDVEWSL